MNKNQYCVIMAGGSGSSLWPLGREALPKQFTALTKGRKSLLQLTYERFLGVVPQENILVVTLRKYADLVSRQLPGLAPENLLQEPYGRHTAPCVAYSTYALLRRDPEAVVAVTPSDQVIDGDGEFCATMKAALDYASEHSNLITIGVKPTRPDTDYGYIQCKGGRKALQGDVPVPVKTFLEKPGLSLAEKFVESGEFLWNSGIFVWKASVIREEMEKYIPAITSLFKGWELALGSPSEKVFLERVYADCTVRSIDYGVMERTDRALVIKAKFGWADVSSWNAIFHEVQAERDEAGNVLIAPKHVVKDSRRNLLMLSKKKGKLIAVSGLENFVVVDTDDVLLICSRHGSGYDDLIAGLSMPGYEKYR